jgi:hypothetical protein
MIRDRYATPPSTLSHRLGGGGGGTADAAPGPGGLSARPDPSRSASPNPSAVAGAGENPFAAYQNQSHRTAEELESQNDSGLEGLSAKVKVLRDVRAPLSFLCPLSVCMCVCVSRGADCAVISKDHDRHWQRSARFHKAAREHGKSSRTKAKTPTEPRSLAR